MPFNHREQLTQSQNTVPVLVIFAEHVLEVLGYEAAFWVICPAVGAMLQLVISIN
jgi:hypothetical protein